jgi:hypothetical protein
MKSSFLAAFLASLPITLDPLSAQTVGADYPTRERCESTGRFSASQCRTAFENASAEFEEKAPRFKDRKECERYFRRCMIGGLGSQGASFMPSMTGVRITDRSSFDQSVIPLIEGTSLPLAFSPRSMLRSSTQVSPKVREDAQRQWAQMVSPPVRDYHFHMNGSVEPEGPTTDGPLPDLTGVPTYPAPPRTWRKP